MQSDQDVLPAEYVRCEYLESTVGQHIITDLRVYQDTKCHAVVERTGQGQIYQAFLGAVANELSNPGFVIFASPEGWNVRFGLWNNDTGSNIVNQMLSYPSGKFEFECGFNLIKYNGETYTGRLLWDDSLSGYPIGLFCRAIRGTYMSNSLSCARIYSLSFTSSTQNANYIPCLRISDGEAGMYDSVSKQFFTNQGFGKFKYKILEQ